MWLKALKLWLKALKLWILVMWLTALKLWILFNMAFLAWRLGNADARRDRK